MMAMLLDREPRKKSRARSTGDTLGIRGTYELEESDDAGLKKAKAMKAVASLHKLHCSIKERPKRICELFEKAVLEDLGIHCSRTTVDIEGLCQEATVGELPWDLPLPDHGCRRLPVPPIGAGGHCVCPGGPEPEVQDAMRLEGGRLGSAWLLTGSARP